MKRTTARRPRSLTFKFGRCGPLATVAITALAACGDSQPPAPPPLEIPVANVIQRDVPIEMDFVGQTLGSVDIPIRARVEGFLEGMHFREGREVAKGDLLYTIDQRPFQSKVVEVQGYVAEARTRLANAKSDLERIRPLAEMNAVSQQDLDGAVAQYEAAKGSLQAAEAQLEQAEIELSYTRILAPTDGYIGITGANVGEFVSAGPGSAVLNYVSKIDPIRVRFSMDERRFLIFAREFAADREVRRQDQAAQRQLELILADGSVHQHKGRVVASDAAINPDTGTLSLEADFPNPAGIVIAGQFARVRGVIETRNDALLVPQRAVSELQGRFRVFVIRADNTVELREIQPGQRIGSLWLVDSGLQAGERIAVEGIQRLANGMTVVPVPATVETG